MGDGQKSMLTAIGQQEIGSGNWMIFQSTEVLRARILYSFDPEIY
jgi:hypothetical protein